MKIGEFDLQALTSRHTQKFNKLLLLNYLYSIGPNVC